MQRGYELDETTISHLESIDGPVGRYLRGLGERITQEAKRRAPVSKKGSNGRGSGWLRSHIGWQIGQDSQGPWLRVWTPAETPRQAPYGLFQERGTSKMRAQPHLLPAYRQEIDKLGRS